MSYRNSPIYKGLDRICRVLTTFSMMMLALMSVLVVGQVILRNFFDLGLPWADELSRISNIALVFFAVPALMLHNRHIAIDLLFSALGPRGKATLRFANYALITLFSAIFLYGLYKFLMRAGKFSTPSLSMPNYAVYAPVVMAIVLLLAVALYRLISRTEPVTDYEDEDGGNAIAQAIESEMAESQSSEDSRK
ncbi:TRAP transporter permease DctQ [Candidatus Kaiserbacteria bacterium]|jgi:TRAP-type C4-dicarboxylate transport system permease small subunit|nr:MAG: TRAP transporter permease DctQ [Candidatus Kaiserbacteria bacterium]|tara:strand:+ start:588 stop:1166 length:579 start_codon:yes stop_codon:yes gene_type:complete